MFSYTSSLLNYQPIHLYSYRQPVPPSFPPSGSHQSLISSELNRNASFSSLVFSSLVLYAPTTLYLSTHTSNFAVIIRGVSIFHSFTFVLHSSLMKVPFSSFFSVSTPEVNPNYLPKLSSPLCFNLVFLTTKTSFPPCTHNCRAGKASRCKKKRSFSASILHPSMHRNWP